MNTYLTKESNLVPHTRPISDKEDATVSSYLSITPARMRSINQTAVIEYIRVNKKASRAIIAKKLDLSLPSVVRIIDDLMERGYVCFSGEYEESGGRKRPLVEFDTLNNMLVSVEIGHGTFEGCVLNLGGEILMRQSGRYSGSDPEEALQSLVNTLEPLVCFAKSNAKYFRGIALAVPSIVDHKTGEVNLLSSFQWKHYPLQTILQQRFQTMVVVENDANAAALGEMWYGSGAGIYNLVSISMRRGLGVGLIVDGAIYRGPTNAAGELGHIVLSSKDFRPDHTDYGPVEQAIAGVGLLQQARRALQETCSEEELQTLTYESVFNGYYAGQAWAKPIIGSFLDTLAMMIITVSSVMNPEKIILQGEIMDHAAAMMDDIRARIYSDIQVEISHLGPHAPLLGGIVGLMHRQMDYCVLKSLS